MSPGADSVIVADAAIPDRGSSKLDFPPLHCQLDSSSLTCLVGPHRAQIRNYLQMLAGITPPSQGSIEIFQQGTAHLDRALWRQLRSKIGYVSGSAPLLSVQHGLMNVMIPALYHHNRSFHEVADQARALLKELGCNFELTTFPAQLSSLQRSQLALARALILDPELLFLDLPFHDLGANEREMMGELLGTYTQQRTVCMIGGLQYPQFLQQHADRIIYISEHKVFDFDGWTSFIAADDRDVKGLLSVLKSGE